MQPKASLTSFAQPVPKLGHRDLRILVVTLLALVAVARAAAPASDGPDPAIAAQIAEFESRLAAGLAARDRKLLEPLLTDSFTWVHASDGRVDQREVWLASAARGMALSGQRNTRSEHGVTLSVVGGEEPRLAIRTSRVRLLHADGKRESWIRQTHTLGRVAGAGPWKLALGQGVIMYDGPLLDPALHARYAGQYLIADGRKLVLAWVDDSLLATLPNGAETQVFLASPTEESVRNPAAGALRFTLDARQAPIAVALVRDGQEMWRAIRQ